MIVEKYYQVCMTKKKEDLASCLATLTVIELGVLGAEKNFEKNLQSSNTKAKEK